MTPKLKIPWYDFRPFISRASFHPCQQIWGAEEEEEEEGGRMKDEGGAYFMATSDWKLSSAAAQGFPAHIWPS